MIIIIRKIVATYFGQYVVVWFKENLASFHVKSSHLSQVWDYKDLNADCDIPKASGLRNVHCINVFRQRGCIWIKWKQYMTSQVWSDPVLLIQSHRFAPIAAWRPVSIGLCLQNLERRRAWLGKFEVLLAQRARSTDLHAADLRWLRDAISIFQFSLLIISVIVRFNYISINYYSLK